jgi:hypothetical protein
MYFNAETQSRILVRFHFALNNGGFMVLGKAEMLLTHSSIFTPVDLKKRVFAKVPKNNVRDRLLMMAQAGREDAANHLSNHIRIREVAFDVQVMRACLNGDGDRHQLSLDATNRRGKPIQCQVTCTPLLGGNKQVQGAIVLMEGLELG